ncbi:MAG: asparagine synthase (glutamine-hydrolyzing) [Deltaproteobacteria bacterium]|nr:asparagine synthase (glutamine-hydrolyzing) [Deltaproteobacteria bacterium]
MCGIAGIFHTDAGRPVAAEAVHAMVRALDHRGPDDRGVHVDGPVGLGHARLSVIDLTAGGHQPMLSRDGRHALVYNGEVYNYRELRKELEAEGVAFGSQSDTEVVLQVLIRMGARGVARLEGMFAFAFWDRDAGTLLLARDRLGIKPLFFVRRPDSVDFASEPKALPRAGRSRRPEAARIAEYLAFRHLAGEESIEPDVKTLAPGHWLLLRGDECRIERYWEPVAAGPADPEAVFGVIESAVERQLVSDVPVGIFLSGGVDSSLVTAAATRGQASIDSFTVGFAEAGWDESARARVVAEQCRTRSHTVHLAPDAYPAGLLRAIFYLDAPLNHAHSPHLLELSRVARETVTVALTGEGGDELFAGYPRYRLLLAARRLRAMPAPVLRAVAGMVRASRPRWARILDAAAGDAAHAIAINSAFLPLDEAAALAGLDDAAALLAPRIALANDALARRGEVVEALLELERQTYLVSLLQRMDRLSMAVGLECRVPLLDERVVDHALSIHGDRKLTLRDSKIPLRKASSRIFGHAYAYAPKSGFGVPLDAWFRGDGRLARMLARVLADRETRERGLFDVALATRFLDEHRRGSRDRTEALWGLLNLELWARIGLDGRAPGDAVELD